MQLYLHVQDGAGSVSESTVHYTVWMWKEVFCCFKPTTVDQAVQILVACATADQFHSIHVHSADFFEYDSWFI